MTSIYGRKKNDFFKKDGFDPILFLIWDIFRIMCIPYRVWEQRQLLNDIVRSTSVHFMCLLNALRKILSVMNPKGLK